jgi:hypothetical protein
MLTCCICEVELDDRTVGSTTATQKRSWRLCAKCSEERDWEIGGLRKWLAETDPAAIALEAEPFDPEKVVGHYRVDAK